MFLVVGVEVLAGTVPASDVDVEAGTTPGAGPNNLLNSGDMANALYPSAPASTLAPAPAPTPCPAASAPAPTQPSLKGLTWSAERGSRKTVSSGAAGQRRDVRGFSGCAEVVVVFVFDVGLELEDTGMAEVLGSRGSIRPGRRMSGRGRGSGGGPVPAIDVGVDVEEPGPNLVDDEDDDEDGPTPCALSVYSEGTESAFGIPITIRGVPDEIIRALTGERVEMRWFLISLESPPPS